MRVCLADHCPSYVASQRRAEYRDDIVKCADCGGALTAMTDEEADRQRPSLDARTRAVILIGGSALALCGLLYLIVLLLPSHVHFVNGLDRPITLEVANRSESLELAPGDHQSRRLAGRHHIIVRAQGQVVSDEWIDVPRSTDLVVYNVLGAADLCLTRNSYVADELPANHAARLLSGPKVTRLRGKRLVIEDKVSDIFRPAPDSISVPKSEANWSKSRGRLDFCR